MCVKSISLPSASLCPLQPSSLRLQESPPPLFSSPASGSYSFLQSFFVPIPSLLLFPRLTLCPHQMTSQSPPHPHSLCSPSTDRGQALHTPCAAQGCRKEHPLQERKAKRERLLTTWAGPHTPASSTSLAQALNDFQTQDRDRLSSGDSLVGGTVQCPRIWW